MPLRRARWAARCVVGSSARLTAQVAEILSTVDSELSASSLSPEQLADARMYLYIAGGTKPRVIAAAVATRIESAHAVLSSRSPADEADLLRFGEDDGAVFASYVRPRRAKLATHWLRRASTGSVS